MKDNPITDILDHATSSIKRHWLTSLFILLYVLVTVATLRHSAAGFASLEGGNLAWGYLSALAVDAGMALSATGLRKQRSGWLATGLVVSAILSTYTQLLYAIAHAAVIPVASGALWLGDVALLITNARVFILPLSLPVLSIVYSFASKSVGGAGEDLQLVVENTLQQVVELRRERDGLLTEVEQAHKIAPILKKMPQQTLAKLYTQLDGNGTKPKEVVKALGISLSAARRGVNDAHSN